jgi:hypothetical protein
MAQPPAVVVKTCRPVDELQLHLLGSPTPFFCIRCQESKTIKSVATVQGDWTRTICNVCYGELVHARRKKARRDATPRQGTTEVKWLSPNRAAAVQMTRSPPQSITPHKRDKLRRRLPGLDGLVEFFRTAGLRVEPLEGGTLSINGRLTTRLDRLPPPGTAEWNNVVDECAMKYADGSFSKSVEINGLFGEGFHISRLYRENGFEIIHHGKRVGIIHATHVHVLDFGYVYDNFLTPGSHWKQVVNFLNAVVSKIAPDSKLQMKAQGPVAAKPGEGSTVELRRIYQLPPDLTPELTQACLDASRRIRLERQVSYERPVTLEGTALKFSDLCLLSAGLTGRS